MQQVFKIGMDQHKKTSAIHVRDQEGKTVRRMTLWHDRLGELKKLMESLDGKKEVAIEATGFYWWMVQELRRLGAEVHLSSSQ